MGSEVGLTAVITSLTTALSANNLWEIFGNVVPLMAVVTLVALGFYLVRRQIKKMSKMKGGV